MAVTVLATLLRAAFTPFWGDQLPLITFFPAIMLSAWFGGFGPGLTTTLLSALSAQYSLGEPHAGLRLVGLGFFVGIGIFISALTEALRRAERQQAAALARAEAARADVERSAEAVTRLAGIVRTAGDAIISETLEGVITSWNPAAERMFGYSATEAVGRPITIIVPPDRLDEETDLLAQLGRGQSIDNVETERMRKDGRRVPISLTVSPVRNPSGEIVGASQIARDITERREAEEALREVDRRKDQFLAIVSHELRNPLAAIMSAASVLSAYGTEPESRVRPLEIIRRQTEQLARLVDDLLDVARVTTGKIVLQKAPLDLGAATEACVTTLTMPDGAERHRLGVRTESVWIDGDSARVEQIVVNLLTNAIKYTPAGGAISVRVERAGDDAVLSVKDEGIGIAPELLPRVFDLFTQAEDAPVRRHGGLGIGLTLVRRLVELHGGRVEAHSEGPGRGSEFVVWLPCLDPRHLPGDASPSA